MASVSGRIRQAGYRAIGHCPTSIHGTTFRCDPDHFRFWRRVSKGRWEPETYKVLSRFLNGDCVYCDIGSWIGSTAIFAARRSKTVLCFEPDPIAYECLLANIRLNELGNVLPFNVALSDTNGIRPMASFGGKLGDSMTSLMNGASDEHSVHAWCLTWDTWLSLVQPEKIDFLKIDIEGGEFCLLPSLKDYLAEHKPTVYLSTHAPFLQETQRRGELRKLAEVLKIYKHCFNEDMQVVAPDELTSAATADAFRSFLFTDVVPDSAG